MIQSISIDIERICEAMTIITWGAEQNADRIQAIDIIILPRCSFRFKGFRTA